MDCSPPGSFVHGILHTINNMLLRWILKMPPRFYMISALSPKLPLWHLLLPSSLTSAWLLWTLRFLWHRRHAPSPGSPPRHFSSLFKDCLLKSDPDHPIKHRNLHLYFTFDSHHLAFFSFYWIYYFQICYTIYFCVWFIIYCVSSPDKM